MAQPFSSQGKIVALTVDNLRREFPAKVQFNPNDEGKTALIIDPAGKMTPIEWSRITFVRDYAKNEKIRV